MEIFQKTVQDLGGYLPRIIAAVIVLVLGWLLAWLISNLVLRGLRRIKLDDRMKRGIGKEYTTARYISQAVFWLIMLLVIISFFSVLKLPPVAESLRTVLDKILGFLPRLLAAVVLFLVAWALASTLRSIISRVVGKTKIEERLSKQAAVPMEGQVPLSKTLATTAYWLVFLLFLPAILSVLAMEGILSPVEQVVQKIVIFLPNLFVSGLILLVGWFLARVVSRIITNLLSALGTDRLGEKIGLQRMLKSFSLSRVLGLVVYILILIPIVIAALDTLKLEGITEPASLMLAKILGAIPLVFSAALVLVIAYMVGRLVSRLATNLLESANFNALPVKLGLGHEPPTGKWVPSQIVGHLILVIIMLFASVSAFNLLGFEALANLVSQFLLFVGRILMGLVIFALGLYLANLVAKIIISRDFAEARLLSIFARVAVLLLAGAMALRQMGLANEIISLAFGLLLGAVAIAAAIAFGFGGRDIAAHKLDEWMKSLESRKSGKTGLESGKS